MDAVALRCVDETDAALAARASRGDGEAFAELAGRYRPLIAFVTRWPPRGMTREDLRQEALIGLFEACRGHDPARGAFDKLAGQCVRNRVWTAIRNASTRKQAILIDALSLDHRAGPDGDGEELTIAERVPGPTSHDPAVIAEARERVAEVAAALRVLSPRYRDALLRDGAETPRMRAQARRRLQRVLDVGPEPAGRQDGRRYSDEQIRHALALVADGHSLARAGAAVGAPHTTVLRWRRNAA
jgi:RNA polymerase sporulation-specific sigma factor